MLGNSSGFEAAKAAEQLIERLSLTLLVHEQLATAKRFQDKVTDLSVEYGQPTNARNLVIYFGVGDEIAPVAYEKIIWGPQHELTIEKGVKRLIARVPSAADIAELPPQESALPWNDVFLEFEYENPDDERPKRYLLNSRGLVAYETANDIQDNIAAIDTQDLYIVTHPALDRGEWAVRDVRDLITADPDNSGYILQQQDNSIEL